MKSKIARVSGLRSRPGAIMLTAPNNLRGEATGNGLPVHVDRQRIVADCANRHSGEGLVTAGHAHFVPDAQRPPARCPVPQKVKTSIGVGRYGLVDLGGDPSAQTVGPKSRPQRVRPRKAPGVRQSVHNDCPNPPHAARGQGRTLGRGRELADTSRPSARVMPCAVALQTCVLRDRRDAPTPVKIAI